MRLITEGLHQLWGFPPNFVNIYLMGDVLVDAGTKFDRWRILRQLKGRKVTAHALTHAHPDHQGSSHAVCKTLGIPLWCGELDADAAEDSKLIFARMKRHPLNRYIAPLLHGPGHPVSRRLKQGDEVGGFTVIDTPGHSAGHVSYWRESDRVLIVGDVIANMDPLTARRGIFEPPTFFTADVAKNRESARKLAALRPEILCFGHGPPLLDGSKFQAFVARLQD